MTQEPNITFSWCPACMEWDYGEVKESNYICPCGHKQKWPAVPAVSLISRRANSSGIREDNSPVQDSG